MFEFVHLSSFIIQVLLIIWELSTVHTLTFPHRKAAGEKMAVTTFQTKQPIILEGLTKYLCSTLEPGSVLEPTDHPPPQFCWSRRKGCNFSQQESLIFALIFLAGSLGLCACPTCYPHTKVAACKKIRNFRVNLKDWGNHERSLSQMLDFGQYILIGLTAAMEGFHCKRTKDIE